MDAYGLPDGTWDVVGGVNLREFTRDNLSGRHLRIKIYVRIDRDWETHPTYDY